MTTFGKAGWVEDVPGVGSRLEIETREPAVKHGHAGAASAMGERDNEVSCGATPPRTLEAVTRRARIAAPQSVVKPSFGQHAK